MRQDNYRVHLDALEAAYGCVDRLYKYLTLNFFKSKKQVQSNNK